MIYLTNISYQTSESQAKLIQNEVNWHKILTFFDLNNHLNVLTESFLNQSYIVPLIMKLKSNKDKLIWLVVLVFTNVRMM